MKLKKILLPFLCICTISSTYVIPAVASTKLTSISFELDDTSVTSAFTSKLSGLKSWAYVKNDSTSEKTLQYHIQYSDGSGWSIAYSAKVSVGSSSTSSYQTGSSSDDLWRLYIAPTTSVLPKTITGTATLYTSNTL